MDPEVVELGKGITEDDLLFHDEKAPEPSLAYLLSAACGTKTASPSRSACSAASTRPRYDVLINEQISQAVTERGKGDLNKLFHSGDTWQVA